MALYSTETPALLHEALPDLPESLRSGQDPEQAIIAIASQVLGSVQISQRERFAIVNNPDVLSDAEEIDTICLGGRVRGNLTSIMQMIRNLSLQAGVEVSEVSKEILNQL